MYYLLYKNWHFVQFSDFNCKAVACTNIREATTSSFTEFYKYEAFEVSIEFCMQQSLRIFWVRESMSHIIYLFKLESILFSMSWILFIEKWPPKQNLGSVFFLRKKSRGHLCGNLGNLSRLKLTFRTSNNSILFNKCFFFNSSVLSCSKRILLVYMSG